jgi:hypothetical protein
MKEALARAYERAFDHFKSNSKQIVDWASRLYEAEVLGAAWIETAQASVRFKTSIKAKGLQHIVDGSGTDEGNSNSQEVPRKPEADVLEAKLSMLRRNRDVLELQATTLGLATPPHILIQLQDVKADIARLETSQTQNPKKE